MMKELSCRELGSKCMFVARGKDTEDVKRQLWQHAKVKHTRMMRDLSRDDQRSVGRRMDQMMRDVS